MSEKTKLTFLQQLLKNSNVIIFIEILRTIFLKNKFSKLRDLICFFNLSWYHLKNFYYIKTVILRKFQYRIQNFVFFCFCISFNDVRSVESTKFSVRQNNDQFKKDDLVLKRIFSRAQDLENKKDTNGNKYTDKDWNGFLNEFLKDQIKNIPVETDPLINFVLQKNGVSDTQDSIKSKIKTTIFNEILASIKLKLEINDSKQQHNAINNFQNQNLETEKKSFVNTLRENESKFANKICCSKDIKDLEEQIVKTIKNKKNAIEKEIKKNIEVINNIIKSFVGINNKNNKNVDIFYDAKIEMGHLLDNFLSQKNTDFLMTKEVQTDFDDFCDNSGSDKENENNSNLKISLSDSNEKNDTSLMYNSNGNWVSVEEYTEKKIYDLFDNIKKSLDNSNGNSEVHKNFDNLKDQYEKILKLHPAHNNNEEDQIKEKEFNILKTEFFSCFNEFCSCYQIIVKSKKELEDVCTVSKENKLIKDYIENIETKIDESLNKNLAAIFLSKNFDENNTIATCLQSIKDRINKDPYHYFSIEDIQPILPYLEVNKNDTINPSENTLMHGFIEGFIKYIKKLHNYENKNLNSINQSPTKESETEAKKLRAKVQRRDSQIKTLQNSIVLQETELIKLKKSLEDKDEEIKLVGGERNQLIIQNKEIQAVLESLKQELQTQKNKNSEIVKTAKELEKKVEEEKLEKETNVNEYGKQIQNIKTEKQLLEQKIKEIEQEKERLLTQIQNTNVIHQKELEENTNKIKDLEEKGRKKTLDGFVKILNDKKNTTIRESFHALKLHAINHKRDEEKNEINKILVSKEKASLESQQKHRDEIGKLNSQHKSEALRAENIRIEKEQEIYNLKNQINEQKNQINQQRHNLEEKIEEIENNFKKQKNEATNLTQETIVNITQEYNNSIKTLNNKHALEKKEIQLNLDRTQKELELIKKKMESDNSDNQKITIKLQNSFEENILNKNLEIDSLKKNIENIEKKYKDEKDKLLVKIEDKIKEVDNSNEIKLNQIRSEHEKNIQEFNLKNKNKIEELKLEYSKNIEKLNEAFNEKNEEYKKLENQTEKHLFLKDEQYKRNMQELIKKQKLATLLNGVFNKNNAIKKMSALKNLQQNLVNQDHKQALSEAEKKHQDQLDQNEKEFNQIKEAFLNQNTSLKENINVIQKQIEELQKTNASVNKEKENLMSNIYKKEKEIETLQINIQKEKFQNTTKIEEYNLLQESAKKEKEAFFSSLQALIKEQNILVGKNTNLEADLQEAQDRIKKDTEQQNLYKKTYNEMLSKLKNEKEVEIEINQKEYMKKINKSEKEKKRKVSELESELSYNNSVMKKIIQENSAQKEEYLKIEEKNRLQAEKNLIEVKKSYEIEKNKITEGYELNVQIQEKKYKKIEQELISQYQKDISNIEDRNKKIQNELQSRLNDQAKELRNNVENQKELNNKIREKDNTIIALNKEKNVLQEKFTEEQAQQIVKISDLTQENIKLQENFIILQDTYSTSEKEILRLRKDVNRFRTEHNDLALKLDEKNQENASLFFLFFDEIDSAISKVSEKAKLKQENLNRILSEYRKKMQDSGIRKIEKIFNKEVEKSTREAFDSLKQNSRNHQNNVLEKSKKDVATQSEAPQLRNVGNDPLVVEQQQYQSSVQTAHQAQNVQDVHQAQKFSINYMINQYQKDVANENFNSGGHSQITSENTLTDITKNSADFNQKKENLFRLLRNVSKVDVNPNKKIKLLEDNIRSFDKSVQNKEIEKAKNILLKCLKTSTLQLKTMRVRNRLSLKNSKELLDSYKKMLELLFPKTSKGNLLKIKKERAPWNVVQKRIENFIKQKVLKNKRKSLVKKSSKIKNKTISSSKKHRGKIK